MLRGLWHFLREKWCKNCTKLLTNLLTYSILVSKEGRAMPKYDSLRKYDRDRRIWQFYKRHKNWSHQEIADKFGISRSNVSRILKYWNTHGEFS
jgi:hypothetical protein